MHEAPGPKIRLRAEAFNALVEPEPLRLTTTKEKAEHIGADPGNLSRVLQRRQPVSSEFIARVLLTFPKVPFERLFIAEWS